MSMKLRRMLQVIFICGSRPSCGPSVAGLPGGQARTSTGKPVTQRDERQKLLEAGW